MTADRFADPQRQRELVAMSPLGRLGEPEDVGEAIASLASDAARHITGSVVVVDGGRSVR
jgi:meso-butanediol dehydrogenase/(S,S)-butanediol dehydrogenase/diacetyl reductase